MNELIERIYAERKVTGLSGEVHDLVAEVEPHEGANWLSVRRAIAYLRNYPRYRELGSVRERPERWYVRVLAAIMSFPFGRRWWARVLHPALYRQVFKPKADMIAFQKVSEDDRTWSWHDDRF